MTISGYLNSPTDWEQLQRECHPFPAYVDYIYGRPTQDELCEILVTVARQPDVSPVPVYWTPPNLRTARTQSEGSFLPESANIRCTGPGESASARTNTRNHFEAPPPNQSRQFLGNFAATQYTSPQGSSPTPRPKFPTSQEPHVHILTPDELLMPKYAWIPEPKRRHCNELVTLFYSTGRNVSAHRDSRIKAKNDLIEMSKYIFKEHIDHLKRETTLRNIHSVMPRVYTVLKTRYQLPQGHLNEGAANAYWHEFQSTLNSREEVDYVVQLLREMKNAELGGRSPYEVIPGYQIITKTEELDVMPSIET